MSKIVAVYSCGREITYDTNITDTTFKFNGKRPVSFIIPEGLNPRDVHYLYGCVDINRGTNDKRLIVAKDI